MKALASKVVVLVPTTSYTVTLTLSGEEMHNLAPEFWTVSNRFAGGACNEVPTVFELLSTIQSAAEDQENTE